MRGNRLRAIQSDDLPEYPEQLLSPDLSRDYFLMFWHQRWLQSRLCLTASMAVQGAALNLYMIAQGNIPKGSLPSDHTLIARLLRVSDAEWQGYMREAITPLHGWREYNANGEVVLGHDVVIEVAIAASEKREARALSNQERAVAKRRERLVVLMRENGCTDAVCQDSALVEWLDEWLSQNHRGRRQRPQVDASLAAALRAAAKAGMLRPR